MNIVACTFVKKQISFIVLQGDSDDEDFLIRPTDNVIAVGHTHRDFCNIEFYGE